MMQHVRQRGGDNTVTTVTTVTVSQDQARERDGRCDDVTVAESGAALTVTAKALICKGCDGCDGCDANFATGRGARGRPLIVPPIDQGVAVVIEIVGKLGPAPERKPDRLMTAREVIREQQFREWIAAGRPGSGRKKRIARNAKRRIRR